MGKTFEEDRRVIDEVVWSQRHDVVDNWLNEATN